MTITTIRELPSRDGLGRSFCGGETSGVPALDPTWCAKLGKAPDLQAPCVIVGDVIVVVLKGNELCALRRSTGAVLWRRTTQYPGMASSLEVVGDLLVAGDIVVELESGEVIGHLSQQDGVDSLPKRIPVGCGDQFYVPLNEDIHEDRRSFLHLDASQRRFQIVTLPIEFAFTSAPSGKQLIGLANIKGTHVLRGVSVPSHEILWTAPIDGAHQYRYAGDAIIYASSGARIIRIDSGTGETVWDVDLADQLPLSESSKVKLGTPIVSDETIHLKDYDTVIVVGANDGSVIKVWQQPDYLRGCLAGDILFGLGQHLKHVIAYDRFSGEELWRTRQDVRFQNVRACHNNVVCFDGAGRVYCYEWTTPYVSGYR